MSNIYLVCYSDDDLLYSIVHTFNSIMIIIYINNIYKVNFNATVLCHTKVLKIN